LAEIHTFNLQKKRPVYTCPYKYVKNIFSEDYQLFIAVKNKDFMSKLQRGKK